MLTTLTGLVVRERTVGEADKFIDILTDSHGLIEVSVRGAQKMTAKHGSAAQLFAYSTFCIAQRKERYYLNSASPIHIFYGLRQSIEGVSLASYFAEVLCAAVRPVEQKSDILRLMLNTLHFLEKESRPLPLLKALFELRLLTELGMMPNIICCDICGEYTPEQLEFYLQSGIFICKDCAAQSADYSEHMTVSGNVLQAIRHIVLADFDRLFHFRLGDRSLKDLSRLAERYLLLHLDRRFKTLDFYHSLNDWASPTEEPNEPPHPNTGTT